MIVAIFLVMTVWVQPALALSARGLQTLQAQERAQTDEYGFSITIEKASPLQTLLLGWLGVNAYSRLLSFPHYVALESQIITWLE
ncbi:MAG: hypothetical protein ACK4RS_01625 [Thiothrix sp.]